jgi:hypothetical protein
MSQSISPQHPAVVLRSHYLQLRALLAVALVAVLGLSAAVVILATNSDEVAGTTSARPVESINDGGFNPATGRPESAPLPQQEQPLPSRIGSTRYDGGPEEGTRGIRTSSAATTPPVGIRHDGGPEEGTSGPGR